MRIERKEIFEVNGKSYPSLAKAKDAIQGELFEKVKKVMIEKGFSFSEAYKIMDGILLMENDLRNYLNCEMPEDKEE